MQMQRIVALSSEEIGLVSGGECVYEEAKAFWEAVAAVAFMLGQLEVAAAAGVMIAYNDYMAGKYCS